MTEVRLLLGDCLDILPTLEAGSVDAVVTDPPYLNLAGGLVMGLDGGVAPATSNSVSVGDPWDASLAWAQQAWRIARFGVLVMCGFNSVTETRRAFPKASAKGLAVWHYSNPSPSYRNAPRFDVEFIWLLEKSPGLDWHSLTSLLISTPKLPAGCFASERVLQVGSKKAMHPCQKPIALMEALLVSGCDSVLDPFMGLGTTGVACVQTGRSFIGIELDAGYFEIAQKRIEAAQREMVQLAL